MEEQVVVITGASSGIGLVTARTAARRGAAVVLAARNEQAQEIRDAGGLAVHVVADVGKEDDVARIGGQSEALVLLSQAASRLVDRVVRTYGYSSPSGDDESSALHHAGYGLHERGTHQGRWYRRRSCYLELEKHRTAAVAAPVGAGTALVGWSSARRAVRNPRSQSVFAGRART